MYVHAWVCMFQPCGLTERIGVGQECWREVGGLLFAIWWEGWSSGILRRGALEGSDFLGDRRVIGLCDGGEQEVEMWAG